MATFSQTSSEVMSLHQPPKAAPNPVPPQDTLYTPHPSDVYAPPLDIALRLARQDLAVQQDANIHDHQAMIGAAVTLEIRLRQVLAALAVDAPEVCR